MWSTGSSERWYGGYGVADGLFTNAAGALSLRREGQSQYKSSGEQNALHGYLLRNKPRERDGEGQTPPGHPLLRTGAAARAALWALECSTSSCC